MPIVLVSCGSLRKMSLSSSFISRPISSHAVSSMPLCFLKPNFQNSQILNFKGCFQSLVIRCCSSEMGSFSDPVNVRHTQISPMAPFGMTINAAKNQVAMNPSNTVFDAKRLIGRRFSDTSVQCDIKLWPFKVVAGPGDKPMINVNYKSEEKQFAEEEISSMVLIKMKEIFFIVYNVILLIL